MAKYFFEGTAGNQLLVVELTDMRILSVNGKLYLVEWENDVRIGGRVEGVRIFSDCGLATGMHSNDELALTVYFAATAESEKEADLNNPVILEIEDCWLERKPDGP